MRILLWGSRNLIYGGLIMNNFRIATLDRIADLDINGILDCDIQSESKQEAINEFKRMTLNEGIVIYDDEFSIYQLHEKMFNRYTRTY
jgi:hypothetical protein